MLLDDRRDFLEVACGALEQHDVSTMRDDVSGRSATNQASAGT